MSYWSFTCLCSSCEHFHINPAPTYRYQLYQYFMKIFAKTSLNMHMSLSSMCVHVCLRCLWTSLLCRSCILCLWGYTCFSPDLILTGRESNDLDDVCKCCFNTAEARLGRFSVFDKISLRALSCISSG